MADVDPDQLNTLVGSTAKLLQVIDSMRFGVVLLLVTLVIIVLAFVLVGRWIYMKNQDRMERKKAERAAELAGALKQLAESMAAHTDSESKSRAQIAASMDSVAKVTEKVEASMGVLVQRASGQMTKSASLRQIKRQFMKEIVQAICLILERSLRENRYEERRAYVSAKVKTQMGTVLVEARQDMRGAPLAFTPDLFFTTYPDGEGGGERFELCDRIWQEVEHMYRKATPVDERIEEVFLMVQNLISDYVDCIVSDLNAAKPLVGGEEPFRSDSNLAARKLAGEAVVKKEGVPAIRRCLTPLPGTLGRADSP